MIEHVAFHGELLGAATELLLHRLRWERARMPWLPASAATPGVAREQLMGTWRTAGAEGAVLLRDGVVRGYLLGAAGTDELHGARVDVPFAGYALAEGEPTEAIGDLYAWAGERWLERGCFVHRIHLSAAASHWREALLDLGFAGDQVYARRALDPARRTPGAPQPADVRVRQVTADDGAVLRDVALVIARENARAPAWLPLVPEVADALREGYAALPQRGGGRTTLAELEGRVVGFLLLDAVHGDPHPWWCGPQDVFLTVAGTVEGARGRGVGTALLREGLDWAASSGARGCVLDWHAPNLAASRFWRRHGFEPVALRMRRTVDARARWAR